MAAGVRSLPPRISQSTGRLTRIGKSGGRAAVGQSVESVCEVLIKHPDLVANCNEFVHAVFKAFGKGEPALGKETQLNLSLLLNPRIINQTLDVVKQ
jgi:hypothetical protein